MPQEKPGWRRALVLSGLILIPFGAVLIARGLDVAGPIVFGAGWFLALAPILSVPIQWLRGRQADAPFRRMRVQTFILAAALAGLTVGTQSPEAGVALGYVALVWFYVRWLLS